jgi:hypothetical protein
MKNVCSVDKRKKEVFNVLEKLGLLYEFIDDNTIKIYGKSDLYGHFLDTGHLYLEKQSRRLNRRVHGWTCEGIQAIESHIRQHGL